MFKCNLTIIMIFGLVSCGNSSETNQVTIENNQAISTTKNIDAIEGSKSNPLDLSISVENGETTSESNDFSEKKILPDFFNQKKKETKSKISGSGKLLNDPSNPDYMDSIDGGKISVEIETN